MTQSANDVVSRIVEFERDEARDLRNRQKHGLAFSEAAELSESGAEYLGRLCSATAWTEIND